MFLHEVGALLDATDEIARSAIGALRGADHRAPVTAVIAATYAVQDPSEDDALGATYVTGAADLSRWSLLSRTANPNATTMWRPHAG